MKYKQLVLDSFDALGFTPLPHQIKPVNDILEAFLDEDFQHVVLSADTGTGKSVIGAAVSKAIELHHSGDLHAFGEPDRPFPCQPAFIFMGTNVLSEQYAKSFEHLGESEVLAVKGAVNYPCDALRKLAKKPDANADTCAYKVIPEAARASICSECEFFKNKKARPRAKNLISNFAMHFSSAMNPTWGPRALFIFDEAQTLNDAFVEFGSIELKPESFDHFIKRTGEAMGAAGAVVQQEFTALQNEIKLKRVHESNFVSFIDRVAKQCVTVSSYLDMKLKDASTDEFGRLTQLKGSFVSFINKHATAKSYNYDLIYEFDSEDCSLKLKPLFMGSQSHSYLGHFNLYMSATISAEYISETMSIPRQNIKFIKTPTVFDPRNKTVMFYKTQKLNYQTMKDPKVVQQIVSSVREIVQSHSVESEESGLILVPSFAIGHLVAEALSSMPVDVFEHARTTKAADVYRKFAEPSKRPKVLISPSAWEGVDLKDDLSRYQIIVKAPFPSLADRRVKTLCERYPNIYSLMTIMKIVQGLGRSVRSKQDWSTSYIIDQAAERLFYSQQNVWKDQFYIHR